MNDVAIVAGLKDRDKTAIGRFWRDYYDRIYPICAFILGHGPDAVDMTVDVLVDFIEKYAGNLSNPRALFIFLRQMAVRRSLRLRDRQHRTTPFENDVGVDDEATPEEKAELNQLMPYLNYCVDKMTPKAQAAIRLKYTRKISNEQIGHLIGGSKSYIGRLLANAREALRKCIEKRARQVAAESVAGTGWSKEKELVVGFATVERLLELKAGRHPGGCGDFERMVDALDNIQSDSRRDWAARHLATCEECREAFLLLQAMAEETAHPVPRRLRWKRGQTSVPGGWKAVSAAAAVVLALSVVFLATDPPRRDAGPGEGLTVKGYTEDAFFVAVRRGVSSFTVRPLDRLVTGDQLGLFYSSRKAGYLAIFSRDAAGEVSRLYPARGALSAPISSGHKKSLTDGGVVGDGKGCEWLIAVFSETPLELGDIAPAIETAETSGNDNTCDLTVEVPNARTLRVLPVRR